MMNKKLEPPRAFPTAVALALAEAQKDGQLVQRLLTVDLGALLEILLEELARLGPFDGCMVNLIDQHQENLVCQKVFLPEEFAGMEAACLRFKFPTVSEDLNAESYRRAKPIAIDRDSLRQYPEGARSLFERWPVDVLLIVPIGEHDKKNLNPVGTVMLFQRQGKVDAAQVGAVESLLRHFGKPLRNALAFHVLKERERDVQLLVEEEHRFLQFVTRINALTSVEQIYDGISAEFLRRFPFDLAGIFVRDGDQLRGKRFSVVNRKYEEIANTLDEYFRRHPFGLSVAEGASVTAFLRNQHLLFRDVVEILRLPMSPNDMAALRLLKTPHSFLIMPIRQAGLPVGVIWLVSLNRPVRLSESQIKRVELLSSFIGSAMSNAEVYALVQEQKRQIESLHAALNQQLGASDQASRDPLTGLYHAEYFRQHLATSIQDSRQTRIKLALVIFDIDHFTEFTATHAPVDGEAILSEVARRLSGIVRKVELICRYSDQAFVVVLPGSDLEGARLFAERCRLDHAQRPFIISSGEVEVTLSAGCAEINEGEAAASFVARAERALAHAKAQGRNRVVADT